MNRFSYPVKIQLVILASLFYLGNLAAQQITTHSGGQVNTTTVANRIATQLPAAPDLANAWFLVEKLPTQTVGGNAIRARVYAINNLDQVMGINYIGGTTPTIWSASGAHSSAASDYTQELNSAKKLNDFSRFVANKAGPSPQGGIFSFSELGGVVLEQTLPGITLHGINNFGWMLAVEPEQPGYSYNYKSYYGRHFVIKGTTETTIAVPPDAENGAYLEGINIAGQVVGGASPQYGYVGGRGFFAEADGKFRWLTSNNTFEEAYGVNDSGQIVGTTSLPDYSSVPAFWENGRGGGIESLPTVRLPGGFENAWATGINKWGQIVGRTRAGIALWLNKQQLDFTGRLINPENLKLIGLLDINDHGVMLGEQNYTQGGVTYNNNFILRPIWPQLAVDANRDGAIKFLTNGTIGSEDDSDAISADKPYRFWLNDDDDAGDEVNQTLLGGNSDEPGRLTGFWEMDGRTPDYDHDGVDGRCDLADFFPVFLDIKQLVTALPPNISTQYKLKQADSALNFVYTDLKRSDAFDYLHANKERAVYGVDGNMQPHVAGTHEITAAGVVLDAGFLDRVKTGTDKGVILIEGRKATDKPVILAVEKNGVTIAEISLYIKVSEVEKMYRWVNLRGELGRTEIRPSNLVQPENYPDSMTNGKMFIWVHGYNVDERQSRAWNAEAFKRTYQSRSRAMFTAISWFGDYSQVANTVAPNYWENITNGFRTSELLAPVVNSLPGSSKVIVGHSMGNVVVSSAIVDHSMTITKYFMLNAAVALEAYDTSAMNISAMRPNEWANIEERLWSTKWYSLFPGGDGRRGLTWLNRFGSIPNAINYYSSGEDVLNNNDNNPGVVPTPGGERAWVFQEMTKGVTSLISDITLVRVQGGWGVDATWYQQFQTDTSFVTNDIARVTPFFTRFANSQIMDAINGSAKAAEYLVRADSLGGAIPALSFPAGRHAVPAFLDRNVDLNTRQDGWPRTDTRWLHSDAKNAAYYFNYPLWDDWVSIGGLK